MATFKSSRPQLFTVRDKRTGALLGRYQALKPAQAIRRAIDSFAMTAATFRKSQPMTFQWTDLTASVEG